MAVHYCIHVISIMCTCCRLYIDIHRHTHSGASSRVFYYYLLLFYYSLLDFPSEKHCKNRPVIQTRTSTKSFIYLSQPVCASLGPSGPERRRKAFSSGPTAPKPCGEALSLCLTGPKLAPKSCGEALTLGITGSEVYSKALSPGPNCSELSSEVLSPGPTCPKFYTKTRSPPLSSWLQ